VTDAEQLLRLIQSILSKKAETGKKVIGSKSAKELWRIHKEKKSD